MVTEATGSSRLSLTHSSDKHGYVVLQRPLFSQKRTISSGKRQAESLTSGNGQLRACQQGKTPYNSVDRKAV